MMIPLIRRGKTPQVQKREIAETGQGNLRWVVGGLRRIYASRLLKS
ncbi:hypothetical protein [Antarctobacter sp.]|nr:hypothetical protein [Antarctobacter sp.]